MSRLVLSMVPLSASLLAGCYDRHAIDDRASARIDAARAEQAHRFVYAKCPADGSADGQCGLILVLASTEAFREKFRDKKCAALQDADCEALFQRTLDAWLQKRYYAADWQAVARECDAEPRSCDDLRTYELMLARSHNLGVQNDLVVRENEIAAAQRQEHQAASAEATVDTITGLSVAGALLGVPPRRCRHYPRLFGAAFVP